MALKTTVKAGNITNLSDARYCAGMGVDMLGFPVGDGVSADLARFREIAAWVSGPLLVLEWNSANDVSVMETLQANNVSMLQVPAMNLAQFTEVEVPIIVSIDVDEWDMYSALIKQHKHSIAWILVTSDNNRDPEACEPFAAEFKILLSYGFDSTSIDSVLRSHISGIALSGSHEDKPGLKEHSSLNDMLEALEAV